jgi:hypothetical protein
MDHRQLDITVAMGCNVGCIYCPQAATIRASKKMNLGNAVMPLDVFVRCLDKLPDGLLLNFAGYTEPFQNQDCGKMIEVAVEKGFRVAIYTTLKGCSEEDVDRLRHLDLEALEIHLPTGTGREAIKANETYLACLKEVGQFPSVRFLLMAWDDDPRIRDDVAHLVDMDRVVVEHANSRAGNMSQKLLSGMRQPRKMLACDRDLLSNNLLPNGDVTVCCQDFGLRHIIGNLLTGSYESLFLSEEFLRVKAGLDNPDADVLCRTCEYASVRN